MTDANTINVVEAATAKAATASPGTLYHTLISVNNIDQDKFVESDRVAATQHWSHVFIQNTISEEIFDAIATRSGTVNNIAEKASVHYLL